MRMNTSSLNSHGKGFVANLMTIDVHEMFLLVYNFQRILTVPLQVIIIMILLAHILGTATLSAIAALLVLIPFLGIINRYVTRQIQEKVKITDERLKLTNEMIQVFIYNH